MYAVIGEDRSDVDTLKVLIRRLANNDSIAIHGKGYEGCAQMLRKGAVQLRLFADSLKCKRFVICYDCDEGDVKLRYKEVSDRIIVPSKINGMYCVLVPVQELEAWILASLSSVTHVIKSWAPDDIGNPENIASPKEHLERLSRDSNRFPRYSHATHNEKVAKYVDLSKIEQRCPSFQPLVKFVRKGETNHL